MKMEKYSVLMSLYEKENPEFLRASLDSMLNQTILPDEIVLVEDGPLTGELQDVVNEYRNNNSDLLNIVVNEQNLGLGMSLNKGLKACKNELVARMDTDDIAVSNRCEKQINFFASNPSVTIVGGQIAEFNTSPKEITGRRVVPENDRDIKCFMRKRCPFNHMTVMFKKSDIMRAGNYKDWYWNEDYYLWIRLALKNYQFANLPDTLVYARTGEGMYQRRGGAAYFKSEAAIQKLMLDEKIIDFPTYMMNCGKRFIVEKILPNKMRGCFFRMFART